LEEGENVFVLFNTLEKKENFANLFTVVFLELLFI
jgi:hypothetical protein